jgi:hypothetical protein
MQKRKRLLSPAATKPTGKTTKRKQKKPQRIQRKLPRPRQQLDQSPRPTSDTKTKPADVLKKTG